MSGKNLKRLPGLGDEGGRWAERAGWRIACRFGRAGRRIRIFDRDTATLTTPGRVVMRRGSGGRVVGRMEPGWVQAAARQKSSGELSQSWDPAPVGLGRRSAESHDPQWI